MNKIILYKAPWSHGGIKQPYFTSDASRDSYFNSLEHRQVNSDGVNIKVNFNFEITVKVNIDICVAEKYNFAIITYNDTNFYCEIIDMCHIAIGYTILETKRHILSEKTDYLKYFKNYEISKASFPILSYDRNKKYFLPKDLNYSQSFNLVTDIDIVYGDTRTFPKRAHHMQRFLVVFYNTNTEISSANLELYEEPVQYCMSLIPISGLTQKDNYFIRTRTRETDTDQYYGYTFPDIELGRVTTYLNKLSPYIIGLYLISIPVEAVTVSAKLWDGKKMGEAVLKSGYLLPWYGTVDSLQTAEHAQVPAFPIFRTNYLETHLSDSYIINPPSNNTIFDKHSYHFLSRNNRFNITLADYGLLNDVSYNGIRFYVVVNPAGTDLVVSTMPSQANSIVNSSLINPVIIPLQNNLTYSIDAAAAFTAQNRYYNALSRNALDTIKTKGAYQTAENAVIGVMQVGQGLVTKDPGAFVMGASNIVRGISEVGKTVADYDKYRNERDMLAKQAMEAPDSTNIGSSISAMLVELNGQIGLVIEKPLVEDYNYFLSNLHNYGVSSHIFRTTLDLSEFTYDGHFFLQAIAERNSQIINTREFNEMLLYLNGGTRYQII